MLFSTLYSKKSTLSRRFTSTIRSRHLVKIFQNFSRYNIDFKKLENLAKQGVRRYSAEQELLKIDQVDVEALFDYLNPYFRQELDFFESLSVILNKVLLKEAFTDEENFMVSLDRPFSNFNNNFAGDHYFSGPLVVRRRSIQA